MSENDDLSDLSSFDSDFRPVQAVTPGIEALPDAIYDFEIVRADLSRAQNGSRIIEMHVRPNGGSTVQKTYWLNKQNGMNAFGADALTLGIDSSKWGEGAGKVSLVKALPAALAKMKGMRFRGTKASRVDKEQKTWHELHIGSPIAAGTPMQPSKPMPTRPVAPPAVEPPQEDAPF